MAAVLALALLKQKSRTAGVVSTAIRQDKLIMDLILLKNPHQAKGG